LHGHGRHVRAVPGQRVACVVGEHDIRIVGQRDAVVDGRADERILVIDHADTLPLQQQVARNPLSLRSSPGG
jgi:hypothetical protein